MTEPEEYASPACALHEADPAYADPKFSTAEIRAALALLRQVIGPDRPDAAGLVERWIAVLGGSVPARLAGAAVSDEAGLAAQLDRLLPRIADPSLHRDLLALRECCAEGGSHGPGN